MTAEKVKLAVLPQPTPERLSGLIVVARFVTFRGVGIGDGDCDEAVGVEFVEVLAVLPHPTTPKTMRNVNNITKIGRLSILTYSPNLKRVSCR
jgi:hypothetical protein